MGTIRSIHNRPKSVINSHTKYTQCPLNAHSMNRLHFNMPSCTFPAIRQATNNNRLAPRYNTERCIFDRNAAGIYSEGAANLQLAFGFVAHEIGYRRLLGKERGRSNEDRKYESNVFHVTKIRH